MDLDRLLTLAEIRERARNGTARQIRERLGLSQTKLADLLGVSESSVSRWESGERTPRPDVAIRWMRLLGTLEKAMDDTATAA